MAYFLIGLVILVVVFFGVKARKKREVPHYPSILNEYTGVVDINRKTPIEMIEQKDQPLSEDEKDVR